jgi:Siphovirus Gp157.|nr:MAG TPA: resistance protein [Herelleviridae sp.]
MANELTTMSMYELTEKGKEIYELFVNGDLDEDTLKDSREMLEIELKSKSNNLVILYNLFERFLNNKTGDLNREIKRLQELKKNYTARFDKFKETTANCMQALGYKTGVRSGIMTNIGVLALSKSSRETPVDLETVDEKYKQYELKLTVDKETMDKIQEIIGDTKMTVNPKLNKDLYAKEMGILKYNHYSVKVQQTKEEEILNAESIDTNE